MSEQGSTTASEAIRPEVRSVLIRTNRTLGATLVELGLIGFTEIEEWGERMVELLAGVEPWKASILRWLVTEKGSLREGDLHARYFDEHEHAYALIDLRHCDIGDDMRKALDLQMCWATLSVPYEKDGNITCIVTAAPLSQGARTHWEKACPGTIVWHVCTVESIVDFLEAVEAERQAAHKEGSA